MRSFIAASAVATVIAALSIGSNSALAQEHVTVGIVSATTGPFAAPGKFQLNGFNLAAEEINGHGGFEVGGKHYLVDLKIYDVHASAAEGASAMQRLTTVDSVPVVLGELSSAAAAAEAPIAQDNQVPLILTVPTGPELTAQKNPYLFRVNANSNQLSKSLAEFVGKQGWSPLSFIAWNNDAGRGGVNGMREYLPPNVKLGYVGYFNVGDVDFSSHVTNIRSSGAKAVMLLMDEEPGSLAIAQLRAANVPVQIIGTLAMGSDRFLKRLDAARLAGMVQYNAFPPNAPLPRIKAFSERYKAKFGEEAHGFAAQSYDGLFVAIEAMKQAKTVTDGPKIRDALAHLTHEGVIGRIKFDASGQADPPVYVTQWCDDGRRRILYPADMAAGCGAG
ncbi:MAG TPA: ABC transporter substrate-binding protein [Alphaproteobacteria bacterium]|nr:ABC transporter substrate-binding protein [Alphaproteobacteria bacterium]